uniref:Uncharacterized protein n=1 Tax=Anopheles farauti TaxID=69004 RepID=A0A182PZK0_9DIPT
MATCSRTDERCWGCVGAADRIAEAKVIDRSIVGTVIASMCKVGVTHPILGLGAHQSRTVYSSCRHAMSHEEIIESNFNEQHGYCFTRKVHCALFFARTTTLKRCRTFGLIPFLVNPVALGCLLGRTTSSSRVYVTPGSKQLSPQVHHYSAGLSCAMMSYAPICRPP